MIRPIVTDKAKLMNPAIETEFSEIKTGVISDLIQTANHHKNTCLGLSANQIGEDCMVFVILIDDVFTPIVNPVVLARMGGVRAKEEFCLSFPGKFAKKRRHKIIKIQYLDYFLDGKVTIKTFKGMDARVVQHELDHLNGVLI